MNRILFVICVIALLSVRCNSTRESKPVSRFEKIDTLCLVLPENHSDIVSSRLTLEAEMKFCIHQLPVNLNEWKNYREWLKDQIISKSGVTIDHELPLDVKKTGEIDMDGYTIKNIYFQTRPGVYATANLYIPDGEGPFPGVIHMIGHFEKSRTGVNGPQEVGHTLASNGYICLSVDPWGAGERTTTHGVFEYHGANLGASLLNIGESLPGLQISDNVRGVDLLESLTYVDAEKIGATGASGGGNQTMWLGAVDERVKVVIPVVSVGTFESYIMGHNCVCETIPGGLTFTEESGILALVAPRILSIYNALQDSNPAFLTSEMIRSYDNAKPIFDLYGVENNISYRLFDLPHGYHPEMREAMLGCFDMYLKGIGDGEPKKEVPFNVLEPERLMTFPPGQRDSEVVSTEDYCIRRGKELRSEFLNKKNFDEEQKKEELRSVLGINAMSDIEKVHTFSKVGAWDRIGLETGHDKIIPLLHCAPPDRSAGYVIVSNPGGKESISVDLINDLRGKGYGIVVVDLSGTGEVTSTSSIEYDKLAELHTLSRSELWLGKTVIGEWVKELALTAGFLESEFNAEKISVDGSGEAGLAGLFLGVLEGNIDNIILRDAPVSYLFDNRESVDYFSMGIHIPGFLEWGDVSLTAALSGSEVTFIDPVTMSGRQLDRNELDEFKEEFDNLRRNCEPGGKTYFH